MNDEFGVMISINRARKGDEAVVLTGNCRAGTVLDLPAGLFPAAYFSVKTKHKGG